MENRQNNELFDAFCDKLIARLERYYGENYSISISSINKNNGTIKHALLIREHGNNIAPSIYIDNFYKEYNEGMTFNDVLEDIIELRDSNNDIPDFDLEKIRNYELVKSKLGMKLVNRELNKELLKEVPYIEYADLAVVFIIIITEYNNGEASILIKNELFNEWKTDVSELYNDAKENMMKIHPPVCIDMLEVIADILTERNSRLDDLTDEKMDIQDLENEIGNKKMFVLSNQSKWNGAVSMVYTDMLKCIGESLKCDFYILPSSIHEVIIIPDRGYNTIDCEFLNAMVKEVNSAEINEDEVLSDHAYKYHRSNNWLESL